MFYTCIGLALVLCLTMFSAAQAEIRRFGDVIYDLPDDWRPGGEHEGTKLFFSNLPDNKCRFCRFYIASSRPHTGTLTAFLQENRTLFLEEDDKRYLQGLSEIRSLKLGGLPAEMSAARYSNSKTLFLFAVDIGKDRKVLLGFLGETNSEREILESRDTLKLSVLPVFENLKFAAGGKANLLPPAEPGEMSGIWWGWHQIVIPALDGSTSLSMVHKSIVFYPDGHFYDGSPPTGLKNLDREALLADFDNSFGVYRHDGKNRLQLTYADGKSQTMERDKKGWKLRGVSLTEVQPLPDGFKLKGRVSSFNYSGYAPGSGISGGIATGSNTTFSSDGTYTGESFGTVTASTSAGGFANSSKSAKEGRYETRDGLLIMTPKDGSPRSQLIFRVGDGILIGDRFLKDG